ncbi:putative O-methyltransferase [Xylariales sp. AK1849]|nr:putative O-methyltransferase [Xylariales sp. AK1849]
MTSEPRGLRTEKLRRAVQLLSAASEDLISEWDKSSASDAGSSNPEGFVLPSHAGYEAEQIIKAALGTIEELTCSPEMRILEVGSSYLEARALHIVAKHRIPERVAANGEKGVHVDELAASTGLERGKLGRILRLLASEHIFREITPNRFTNNRISQAFVGNEGVQAYTVLAGLHNFTAVDHLPYLLEDPVSGSSYASNDTAFNRAICTETTLYEWFDQKVAPYQLNKPYSRGYPALLGSEKKGIGPYHTYKEIEFTVRPEREIFNKAMVGAGQVTGAALVYDYPWADLGPGTVVDIGAGVGGFAMQLYDLYPDLRFVLQDTPRVMDEARKVWGKENPEALKNGRTTVMGHDFFEKNPVRDADVYWLRYILHNWSDDKAVDILSSITPSMGPDSRILIADHVMNTTLGCDELIPAPDPLPTNYGHAVAYSHRRDLVMMTLFNGIERTPGEFKTIIEAAGLVLTKIWKCRSQVYILECRLP